MTDSAYISIELVSPLAPHQVPTTFLTHVETDSNSEITMYRYSTHSIGLRDLVNHCILKQIPGYIEKIRSRQHRQKVCTTQVINLDGMYREYPFKMSSSDWKAQHSYWCLERIGDLLHI